MPIFTYGPSVAGQKQGETKGGGSSANEGGGFAVARIVFALIVLALIFFAGIYCAHDTAMKDWSAPLLNTFVVLLGGLAGIIIGEKTAAAP